MLIVMLGVMVRFLSGIFIGIPISVIAYYLLPLIIDDMRSMHLFLSTAIACLVGAMIPGVFLKCLTIGFVWNKF